MGEQYCSLERTSVRYRSFSSVLENPANLPKCFVSFLKQNNHIAHSSAGYLLSEVLDHDGNF